jgi:hypothetical protein
MRPPASSAGTRVVSDGRRGPFFTVPGRPERPESSERPILARRAGVGRCRRSRADSDLEAFSRNPSDVALRRYPFE